MPNENEENEVVEETEETKPKSSGNKLIYILIGVLMVLILSVGVGGYIMYDKISNPQTVESTEQKVEEVEEEVYEDDGEVGHIVEFDQMIINLSSAKGKKNYLKLQINIEFRNEDEMDLYNERKALVFDKILTLTSNKTKEELMTIGGKEELKIELKEEFNDILGKKIVKNIYWKTFVIQ